MKKIPFELTNITFYLIEKPHRGYLVQFALLPAASSVWKVRAEST